MGVLFLNKENNAPPHVIVLTFSMIDSFILFWFVRLTGAVAWHGEGEVGFMRYDS